MLFAGKRAILDLTNTIRTLENVLEKATSRLEILEKGFDSEVLKLNNAKELMARASARFERAANRQQPATEIQPDLPQDNGRKDPAKLTNPLAMQMLKGRDG